MFPYWREPLWELTQTTAFSRAIPLAEKAIKDEGNALMHALSVIIFFIGDVTIANNATKEWEKILSLMIKQIKLEVTKPGGGGEYEAFNIKGQGAWVLHKLQNHCLAKDKEHAIGANKQIRAFLELQFAMPGHDAWAALPETCHIPLSRLKKLHLDIDPALATPADVTWNSLTTKVYAPATKFTKLNTAYQPIRWYQTTEDSARKVDPPEERILRAFSCVTKGADANLISTLKSQKLGIMGADGDLIMGKFLRTWPFNDVIYDTFSDPDVDVSAMDHLFPLLAQRVVGPASGVNGADLDWYWESGAGPAAAIEALYQTVPNL
jgi:hypothetical protein